MWFALMHLGLSDLESLFYSLNRAFEERDGSLILITAAVEFDPVREDPRFKALLDKMGLSYSGVVSRCDHVMAMVRLTTGLSSTPRTTLKIAALAPIPSASVRTTVMARPLARASDRRAIRRSVIQLIALVPGP